MKLEKASLKARSEEEGEGKLVEISKSIGKQTSKTTKMKDWIWKRFLFLFVLFFNQSMEGGNWLMEEWNLVDGRRKNPRFERAEDQRIVVTRPLCLLHYPNRF